MSFKITITNNDNGKVLFNEENARAIIGSVVNEENTATLGYTNCNGNDLLNAILGVDRVRDAILEKNPTAKMLYGMKALLFDEH